jgi:hypothetical protein
MSRKRIERIYATRQEAHARSPQGAKVIINAVDPTEPARYLPPTVHEVIRHLGRIADSPNANIQQGEFKDGAIHWDGELTREELVELAKRRAYDETFKTY